MATDTEERNRGQEITDEKFGYDPKQRLAAARMRELEEEAIEKGIQDIEDYVNDHARRVREQEDDLLDDLIDNTTKINPTTATTGNLMDKARQFGPSAGIVGVLIGGSFGFGTFFAVPAALMSMLDRVITNDSADSARTNLIMRRSRLGAIIGKASCTIKVSCKITTMSEKEADNWKKRGFKLEPNEPDADGRYKIKSITFPDGFKADSGKKFQQHIKGDIHARVAANSVINIRSGPFNAIHSKYRKVLAKYDLAKGKIFKASQDRDKAKRTKAMKDDIDRHTDAAPRDADLDTRKSKYEEKFKNTASGKKLKALLDKTGAGRGLAKASNAGDVISFACLAFSTVKGTIAATKALWYKDLIVFAMPFMQTAAQIIDQGNVEPEKVEFMGDRLTWYLKESYVGTYQETYEPDGEIDVREEVGLTAMDSQGIMAMLHGDTSKLREFTKQYMGWGITAAVVGSGVVGQIEESFPGGKENIRRLCNAGNVASWAGLALCIASVIGAAVCAAGITAVLVWGDDILKKAVEKIQDPALELMAKLKLDSDLKGVRLGNAIAAGVGLMMADYARGGGLRAATTAVQVKDFITATDEVYEENTEEIARYEARQNPFDASNQYSFISQVATAINPYRSNDNSLFSNFANIFATAVTPIKLSGDTTHALLYQPTLLGRDGIAEGRTANCEDEDIHKIGAVCDLTGETVGITTKEILKQAAKQTDGEGEMIAENVKYMVEKEYIDEDGKFKEDSDYAKYRKFCTEQRIDPPGTSTEEVTSGDYEWSTYAKCIGNDINGEKIEDEEFDKMLDNFAIYYNMCETQIPMADEVENCWGKEEKPQEAVPCQQGWTFPTDRGAVQNTSGFGERWGTQHQGVDLAGPIGTPVYAACEGTVVAAGSASGFGQWIVIDHDINGKKVSTVYGHVDTIDVSVGQQVTAGQKIGTIGNRGESTGPHLHFEIWEGGRLDGGSAVDPAPQIGA